MENTFPTKITDVNLYALATTFRDADVVPNRITAVDYPHLRRCFRAGLMNVDGESNTLSLTDLGRAALAERDRYIAELAAARNSR